MKPLRDMRVDEVAKIAKAPVQERCNCIIDEFDQWLAIHAVRYEFKHTDLPQLNDAFRDYFAGTRTARPPAPVGGDVDPAEEPRCRPLEEAVARHPGAAKVR
jgi:hypothetical protein